MQDTELRSTLLGIVQTLNTHTQHFETIFKRFDSLEMRVTRLEEITVKRDELPELITPLVKNVIKTELTVFQDEFHNALKNLITKDEFLNALKNLATKDEVDKLALLLAQTRSIAVDTREDVKRIEAKLDITCEDVYRIEAKLDTTREDVVQVDATITATREDVKTLGSRMDFYVQKSLVHEKEITTLKRRISV